MRKNITTQPIKKIADLTFRLSYRSALLLSLFVFIFAFTISSVFARSLQDQNELDFNAKVKQQATSLQTELLSASDRYRQLLLHASSLFAVKGDMSREDWTKFYQTSDISTTYPTLMVVGYAPTIAASDQESFVEGVRESGNETFEITPSSTTASTLNPILYIEPNNAINQPVLGFDMASDSVRRAAMDQARDDAEPVMTAPVELAQDKTGEENNQTGVLIYYPVYSSGVAPSTVEARRAEVRGFVYVALHPSDLVKSYLDSHQTEYADTKVEVQDVTDEKKVTSVFLSEPNPTPATIATSDRETGKISGRTWAVTTTGWMTTVQRYSPFVVFGLGTVVSLLLAWMIYRVMVGRMRHIATAYEGEVQRTKDELLALTSHQLRTPASGVKQYLGILTSGILGEMSHDQMEIAQKAYDANERQLQIINELLYVSKADAGQLVIEPKHFDLTALAQKCIDNFGEQASQKDISINFATKKPHFVTADDRYISMAIENLVSNAVKYSYPSSKVRIGIRSRGEMVSLYVKDTGVGVDPKDYERIFEKFDRIDNPLSHSEGGSGLGLFLARQLARAHGGDVTVESQLENGSTFVITLPKKLTINQTIVHLNRIKKMEEES